MKTTIFALLMTLSALTLAAPINQAAIPADAKWLFHIDFDALRASQIGGLVRKDIEAEHGQQIEGMSTLFGTDLLDDVYGATLYGPDADEANAVALIHVKYDKDKLLALLKMGETYAETDYQGKTLYHWHDDKRDREQVGAFINNEIIAISQTDAAVTGVLDLMDKGTSKSLANSKDNPLTGLSTPPQGAIVMVAADGLSQLADGNEQAAVLKNSKMMAVIAGETGGNLKLTVDLIAETAESATQIE